MGACGEAKKSLRDHHWNRGAYFKSLGSEKAGEGARCALTQGPFSLLHLSSSPGGSMKMAKEHIDKIPLTC